MTCFRVESVTTFDEQKSSRSRNFTRTLVEEGNGGRLGRSEERKGEEDKEEGEKESACDSRERETDARA